MKRCGKCLETKPICEYWRRNEKYYQSMCKSCTREYASRWRALDKNKLKHKESYRKWYESKGKDREKHYRRSLENFQRVKTRMMLNNEVRSGRIKRGNCVECDSAKSEAHHEDYSKPFDVVWLCRKCHINLHKKEKIK